jgi:hypothetical protein
MAMLIVKPTSFKVKLSGLLMYMTIVEPEGKTKDPVAVAKVSANPVTIPLVMLALGRLDRSANKPVSDVHVL